jgi:hypothetical protein
MNLNRSLLLTLAWMISFFWVESVPAAPPPSEFQIKQIVQKRPGFQNILVTSTVFKVDGERKVPLFRETTSVDWRRGRIQSRAFQETENSLFQKERTFLSLDAPTPISLRILFERDFTRLALALQKEGVPVRLNAELLELADEEERRAFEEVHFRRLDGKIAWAIENRHLEGSPRFWIEKDSFLPLKFSKSNDLEIRYQNYREISGFLYPRKISILREGKLAFIVEVDEINVNLEKLPSLEPFENSRLSSSLREAIDLYYEHIR